MLPFRRQLAVASPITAGILAAAALDTTLGRDRRSQVAEAVTREFGASAALLTDSGTSALVLALRLAAGAGGTIAMPGYACVDLIAAARRANVAVRLYDIDPLTLTPDLDSVARVLAQGARAIVVAHLYGYPADVAAIRTIVDASGAVVIEDAAQQAGATLRGVRAGSMGDMSVLSFGRGKGTTAGNGGALLAFSERWTNAVADARSTLEPPSSGRSDLVGSAASWSLGRPALYALPASIPALHLGETVFHEAHEPRRLSRAAAALLHRTLLLAPAALSARRQRALRLRAASQNSHRVESVVPLGGAEPGYLRFPVRVRSDIAPAPRLGITPAYPRPLSEEPELQPLLVPSPEPLRGAHDLARQLVTLPTHHMLTSADMDALVHWLQPA